MCFEPTLGKSLVLFLNLDLPLGDLHLLDEQVCYLDGYALQLGRVHAFGPGVLGVRAIEHLKGLAYGGVQLGFLLQGS